MHSDINLLMELLAIRLGGQTTPAKSLVMRDSGAGSVSARDPGPRSGKLMSMLRSLRAGLPHPQTARYDFCRHVYGEIALLNSVACHPLRISTVKPFPHSFQRVSANNKLGIDHCINFLFGRHPVIQRMSAGETAPLGAQISCSRYHLVALFWRNG